MDNETKKIREMKDLRFSFGPQSGRMIWMIVDEDVGVVVEAGYVGGDGFDSMGMG